MEKRHVETYDGNCGPDRECKALVKKTYSFGSWRGKTKSEEDFVEESSLVKAGVVPCVRYGKWHAGEGHTCGTGLGWRGRGMWRHLDADLVVCFLLPSFWPSPVVHGSAVLNGV